MYAIMRFNYFLFAVLFIALNSCEKDNPENAQDQNITLDLLKGYVQKGPFVNGTAITISELNKDLTGTGKNFNTQIVDNKGTFELRNISLKSNYVELKADGFYFDEIKGATSPAQLTLYALSDLSEHSSINVNLLTHLEKSRMEFLIGEGHDFNAAKKQSQNEILSIFGFETSVKSNSENLDISLPGEENAVLLAISSILQADRSVGNLTELLANIGTDIRTDGILNSNILFDTLYEGAYQLDYESIRQNLEFRYAQLGVDAEIAKFETYIDDFLNPFEISYTITPVACDGESTGAIELNVSMGTEPYTFIWSNGNVSQNISGLSAGVYSVLIKDANNLRWTLDSLVVEGTSGLGAYSTVTHNSANIGGNGSIEITPYGGTPPYTFLWDDDVTEEDRTGLSEGLYTLTIADDNGCIVIYEYTIKSYEYVTDDRDGQTYPIVQIGEDWWMAKNLNYRVEDSYYKDDDSLKYAGEYGRLYSLAVNMNVCPSGWHLPTVTEVDEMKSVLGEDVGVKLLNETQSIVPWWEDALEFIDQSHLNSSGFSARLGYFSLSSDESAMFWIQEKEEISGMNIQLTGSWIFEVYYTDEREPDFPVRCVKD